VRGLSASEAERRLAVDGPNLLPGTQPKPLWAIVRGVLTEPMFLMLLVAGGLYLALGDRAEAVFLLSFVFVVIGITLAQERRTQRALEALRELSAPRALVLRDGEPRRIPGREVVRGDVLVRHEGDRVAADALLCEGALVVDESLLTGESATVAKRASPLPDAALDPPGQGEGASVYAGTVVTGGRGLAVVRETGGATAVGRIGLALAGTVEPPSGLQRASRRLIRRLTVAGLVLACALVLVNVLWNQRPPLESLLSGVALAMAILPEEIPVIMTVFLALGAWRIASRQVLTRRVTAVEALGAITVLAVDKTGTLTLNRMAVAELAIDGESFRAEDATTLPEAFHGVVEFAMLATPADPFDPMEQAIQAFGQRWLAGTEHLHADADPAACYELSPEIVAMTRVYPQADPSRFQLATKGAPEAVVDLCHLPEQARATVRAQVAAMASRGLRVLGVARGEWSGGPPWPASQHDFRFEFLGLVAFADPPRPEVPAAIAECRAAGVRVLMLTGDHPETAAAIARQVGLSARPEVLTGPQLAQMDDAALRGRLRELDVCARLRPEHKLRLVQLLQAGGEVVAMTGDGVNDAPALKAADVGIAMGRRGTDVAREAAALVLLDDRFASIVAALRQGRRIHDNMSRAIRFVFAVHLPVVALALVPALLGTPVLLLPVHIVLLELLIDPACSLVFEAEPEAADLMTRPPRPVGASPFDAGNLGIGLAQGAGLAGVLLAGSLLMARMGTDPAAVRLAVFGALVIGLFALVVAGRDHALRPRAGGNDRGNPWLARMLAVIAVVLGAVSFVPWLREVMRFAWGGASQVIAVALMVALATGWLALLGRRVRPAHSDSAGS
jgi:Ca2+-transporting ATPase